MKWIRKKVVRVENDVPPEIPKIREHYKNRQYRPEDNVLLFTLRCHSFDCPSTVILFHKTSEGLVIEFADDEYDFENMKSNFTVVEKFRDVVTFRNKKTKDEIFMKRNSSNQRWFINDERTGNKEVNSENSNFFKLYCERILTGVPITSWVKSENNAGMQIKLFVSKNSKLTNDKFFWRFRFKGERGSWEYGKENNPIHKEKLAQEIADNWVDGKNFDSLVSQLV